QVRRYGPAFLVLYCLVNVLLTSGERALYFNPAEVNFLFSGPFSRRQLLAYKITSSFVIALPSTLILAALLQVHASWFVAAYVGLVLMFLFLQLFAIAVNLLATTAGAQLYSRGRKLTLVAVLVLLGLGVWQAGRGLAWEGSVGELLARLEQGSVWRVASQ